MAPFFRSSTVWVVDFNYDGAARQWYRALPQGVDAPEAMTQELDSLYGKRARLGGVRPATEEEELRYLRGELPRNVFCPTGR